MPRSRGAIIADTDNTIKNRSLPSIIEKWDMMGLIEGVDFVIGKAPPKDWEKPYNRVKSYKNTISWWNGVVIDLVSLYSEGAARGGNYQFIIADEAALISHQKFLTNVIPTLRGCYHKVAKLEVPSVFEPPFGSVIDRGDEVIWQIPFKDNPLYNSITLVSSMPWTTDGQWLLDFEEDPDACYIEATAVDNQDVVGPDYIDRMRRTMPDIVFRIEVMNERIGKLPSGFYSEFYDTKHVKNVLPYDTNKELIISFDFNAGFNSMIVAQFDQASNTLNIIDDIYVKGNLIVDDLVEAFMDRYKHHQLKEVDIYGDRNGNNRYAGSTYTLYQTIENLLIEGGWIYNRSEKGLDAPHKFKHDMINTALKEKEGSQLPKIRIAKKCKSLIISINTAPITEDFKKDKKSERSSTILQEHATHLSDCLDNLYIFAFKDYYSLGTSLSGGWTPYIG